MKNLGVSINLFLSPSLSLVLLFSALEIHTICSWWWQMVSQMRWRYIGTYPSASLPKQPTLKGAWGGWGNWNTFRSATEFSSTSERVTADIIGLITSNQKETAVINENVVKDPVFTEAAWVLMLNAGGMNRKDRARNSVSEPNIALCCPFLLESLSLMTQM